MRETSDSTEKRFNKEKKIRDSGEKALARGVALLGVKVTGITFCDGLKATN